MTATLQEEAAGSRGERQGGGTLQRALGVCLSVQWTVIYFFCFVLLVPSRKQEATDGVVEGWGVVSSETLSICRQDVLDHREPWSSWRRGLS